MALSDVASGPWGAANSIAARTAKLTSRNIRATVGISIILICGSFAAAAALQMRLDRVHALDQANYYEQRRAADLADVLADALDRNAALGATFARGTLGTGLPAGVRGIALYDSAGIAKAALNSSASSVPISVLRAARRGRVVAGDLSRATVAFPFGQDVLTVTVDTDTLAPVILKEGVAIVTSSGEELATGAAPSSDSDIRAAVRGWPVVISIPRNDNGALSAWYRSLPLYLFVILGPGLVGAVLAPIFAREFERRLRATETVRSLRNMQPADARLLVRLAQAEREAVEAQRSKAEFIAHMSHELRTPLNAVIGFSEIIEQGMYGNVGHPKYIEYARDIAEAGRGLHIKVGDILEFSNLEAGRYPIAPVDFDLVALARSVTDEHMGSAFSRRIALEFRHGKQAIAHGDPLAVKRILANLLSNALTYTPEGGRVRVEIQREEAAVIACVLDDGPGFKPDEAARAGTAFVRFDRKGAKTGAGLGLAIAMALAHRMGGALRLASVPGGGTGTELRLQRARES